MTDLERELLELVLEQTIAIRNLKIKIRLIEKQTSLCLINWLIIKICVSL